VALLVACVGVPEYPPRDRGRSADLGELPN
jgi:hypothetical protein